MMDSITERIAGLPEWSSDWEPALIARLALAREWIVSPRHFPECENKSIAALFCHECEGKVLDALEVPK